MFYRREISAQATVLLLLDLLLITVSFALAHIIRFGVELGWDHFTDHVPTLLGVVGIFLPVFFASGLYDLETNASPRSTIIVGSVAILIGIMLVIVFFYARFQLHFGRGVLLITAALIWLALVGSRSIYRRALGSGLLRRTTLLVGDAVSSREILRLLEDHGGGRYRVMGIIHDGPAERDDFIMGVPVLGDRSRLKEFVKAYHVETIILATTLGREIELLSALRPLRYSGIQLLDYASLHEDLAHCIPLDHIDDEWLLHAALNSSRIHIRKIKRILDLMLAVPALILSLPLSLLAALMVRLDSPGPIFYKQRRSGLGGEVFTLYKFRTMRVDAEAKSGAIWAEKYDQRITRSGRFLRASRLDEIPQLWNVIRGEMSFVGPRPERPEFVVNLAQKIPFYMERLMVPPGITGWAQVSYPYAASVEATRLKLQYDLYYIKHMSLILDLTILLRTAKTILVGLRHSEANTIPVAEDKSNSRTTIHVVPPPPKDEKTA